MTEFVQELDARIARFDLLCHPFYQAWSDGKLTTDDLREYSAEYYHHVAAFPTYLSARFIAFFWSLMQRCCHWQLIPMLSATGSASGALAPAGGAVTPRKRNRAGSSSRA